MTRFAAFALFVLWAVPSAAQLVEPNQIGVRMGHMHLVVRDVEGHKQFFTSVLGGTIVKNGPLESGLQAARSQAATGAATAEWRRILEAGQGARIRVTLADGDKVEGTVITVADDQVVVRREGRNIGGELTLARSNVQAVDVLSGRPWSKGKKIAVFSAVAAGALFGVACATGGCTPE